jgi:hypothetical protein
MKTLLIISTTFFLYSCTAIVVDRPESPKAIMIPDSLRPNFIWIGDSWQWNRKTRTYKSKPGYWAKPKKKSVVWVDGHWLNTRSGWKYVKGHWRSVG